MSDWDSGQVMPNNEAAFDAAIEQLRVQAFALSTQFTSDAVVRKSYVKNIQAMTSDLRMKVRLGELTWKQAAEEANVLRNEIMAITRGRTAPIGLAIAQKLKKEGLTLNAVVAKRTLELFGENARFDLLTQTQKAEVYKAVMDGGGRGNVAVSTKVALISQFSRALLILSLSVSAYVIFTSPQPMQTAKREGAVMGAGLAGSVGGGMVAGLMCGPGSPVCVALGAFAGGVMFAMGMAAYW